MLRYISRVYIKNTLNKLSNQNCFLNQLLKILFIKFGNETVLITRV